MAVGQLAGGRPYLAATLRKLTCGTLAEFPVPITIETTKAVAVISAGVVYVAIQRIRN